MLAFDKRRLQQVILNLLSNAIKFQETGIIIVNLEIGLELMSQKDIIIMVRVQDQGIGMTDEEVENAFVPFWRLNNETS